MKDTATFSSTVVFGEPFGGKNEASERHLHSG